MNPYTCCGLHFLNLIIELHDNFNLFGDDINLVAMIIFCIRINYDMFSSIMQYGAVFFILGGDLDIQYTIGEYRRVFII
jgi:hypothetical protein